MPMEHPRGGCLEGAVSRWQGGPSRQSPNPINAAGAEQSRARPWRAHRHTGTSCTRCSSRWDLGSGGAGSMAGSEAGWGECAGPGWGAVLAPWNPH